MDRKFIKTYETAGDIPAYRMVSINSDRSVEVAQDKTKSIIGVSGLRNSYQDRIDITHMGIVPIIAGAPIEAGKPITCDSEGKAIKATAVDYVFGVALEAATQTGDQIEILITHGGT